MKGGWGSDPRAEIEKKVRKSREASIHRNDASPLTQGLNYRCVLLSLYIISVFRALTVCAAFGE